MDRADYGAIGAVHLALKSGAPRGIRTRDPRFQSLASIIQNGFVTYKIERLYQRGETCFERRMSTGTNLFYSVR